MNPKRLPRSVADLGTSDCSGMWLDGSIGGVEVVYVTANGHSAAAVLHAGDIFTAVDGKPVVTLPVYELLGRLRVQLPGDVVGLTIGEEMHIAQSE